QVVRQVPAGQRDDDGVVSAKQDVDQDDLKHGTPVHRGQKLDHGLHCFLSPAAGAQSRLFSSRPISDGSRVTLMTQASITSSLACAVSSPPEFSAPAWPMRLPAGAVTPAMNPTTGFFMLSLIQRAAVTSPGPP